MVPDYRKVVWHQNDKCEKFLLFYLFSFPAILCLCKCESIGNAFHIKWFNMLKYKNELQNPKRAMAPSNLSVVSVHCAELISWIIWITEMKHHGRWRMVLSWKENFWYFTCLLLILGGPGPYHHIYNIGFRFYAMCLIFHTLHSN